MASFRPRTITQTITDSFRTQTHLSKLSSNKKLTKKTKAVKKKLQNIINEYAEDIRSQYLQVFDNAENLENCKWKQHFIMSGDEIKQLPFEEKKQSRKRNATDSLQHHISKEEIIITFGDRTHTFPIDKNASENTPLVITVGTMNGCDVQIGPVAYSGLSRLHLILYVFPQRNVIMVVDVGSLLGFSTKERSEQSSVLEESRPNHRKTLTFSLSETFILQLGEQGTCYDLAVNTKSCVICQDSPRDVVFNNCNHFVVCSHCVDHIDKCPICNTNLDTQISKRQKRVKTYVGQS